MSDVINLNWIGAQLRAIQAQQRTDRAENELIRSALGDVVRVLNDRIADFETNLEARIDRLEGVMNVRFEGVHAILDRIEAHLGPKP